MTSCPFPSRRRLEETIPAFEPYVGRYLYIRSSDVHNWQTKPGAISQSIKNTDERTVAESHMTVTGAPLSVLV